jgi:hypothetical protein
MLARLVGVAACAWGLAACGYQPVYAAGPQAKLRVAVVRSLVPDAVAADEVAAGMRDELARAGALQAGEGYPRVEIEVLRADEASEGIVAGPSGPLSRATDIALVARAWIAASPGVTSSDTGDMRAEVTIAVDATPLASGFHAADALRAAGRRLGHAMGARLLGLPAATEEP